MHGRTGDLDAYLLADKLFHRTLLDASGNEMYRALNAVVAEVLTSRIHDGMMPATPNPAAIELHDDVARAIRTGEASAAEAAMRAILDEAASAVSQ
jgi:DNA-binding FadR family transcriptional regulator